MKNIHVLPTDKPSRVYNILGSKRIGFTSNDPFYTENFGGGTQNQNIYITSDEEIKEDYWCLDIIHNTISKRSDNRYRKQYKKIILTTDQDLIADGVQAIEDEFLEWFVKNPSCENVELQKWAEDSKEFGTAYSIIFPKEEPKQIYYNTVGRERGVFVVKGQFNTQKEALDLANELNRKFPGMYYDWNETLIKEGPKQETLTSSEAAKKEERLFNSEIDVQAGSKGTADYIDMSLVEVLVEVAKQKLYTEEEVRLLIWESRTLFLSKKYLNLVKRNRKHKFTKWFENNKKK